MALQPCTECKAEISDKAGSCPHCGAPVEMRDKPYVREKANSKNVLGSAALLIVGVIIWKSFSSDSTPTSVAPTISANSPEVSAREPVASLARAAEILQDNVATAPDSHPGMTAAQKNALRSAEQYLQAMSFSRSGLIQQLSSNAGSGYELEDATVAVDSLNVDWDQQAVQTAKQYLSTSGFSCKGLVEQLSSKAGSGFTVPQAQYGAKQAGAC